MASYFRESRNAELSTLDYLKAQINAYWSDVNIVKSYNDASSKALPVVAVQLTDTETERREIGNTEVINKYVVNIDIFAKSDAMRLDLTSHIVDILKAGWVYYQYSHGSGDNTTLVTQAAGRVTVEEFVENTKVEFGTDVDVYDKYRQFIQIRVRVDV